MSAYGPNTSIIPVRKLGLELANCGRDRIFLAAKILWIANRDRKDSVCGVHEACFSHKIKRRLNSFKPKRLNMDFLLAGDLIYGEERR